MSRNIGGRAKSAASTRRFPSGLFLIGLFWLLIGASQNFAQTVIIYENDFENPNVPVQRTCGYSLDQRGIQYLYGGPLGNFQQTFTVEAVLINYTGDPNNTGGAGRTYSDPSGLGGNYAMGMLASRQPDLLSLTFDSQGKDFINIGIDISSIDVTGCGGPFNISDPRNPRFRISLRNTPGGAFSISNPGASPMLDQVDIVGSKGPTRYTFDWTHHVVTLDTSGSSDGIVTLVWDLLEGGYASFDNLIITASDTPGDLGQNQAPLTNAGPDQVVVEGLLVNLDGTGSSDPDGDALTYSWTQVAGEPVMLSDYTSASPSFTAPLVNLGGDTLTFELIVNDGTVDGPADLVEITVNNLNNPPVAVTGPDQTLIEGAVVTLDASDSYDIDGDVLSYQWTQISGPSVLLDLDNPTFPTFTAPPVASMGESLLFELIVHDGVVDSAPSVVEVFVASVNQSPTADAGIDMTLNENSPVTLDGSNSSDPDGDALSYSWVQIGGPLVNLFNPTSPSPTFVAPDVVAMASEVLTFELTVSDGYGGVDVDSVEITVLDLNAAPACELAQPSAPILWPPNHKFRQIDVLGVADPDNDTVVITILSVTQDEPLNELGDGNTSPDAHVQGESIQLRAERAGGRNGRVYHIDFLADDGVGGSCTGGVSVCVPHDKRPWGTCVDDGAAYNSLGD